MVIPDMKRLPALLARARREIGCDQPGLARAVGTSVRSISRWETGKHYPSPEQASDLAFALSNASSETWRALVDALKLSLDEMLALCPNQKAADEAAPGRKKHAHDVDGASTTTAIVPLAPALPAKDVPVTAVIDLQSVTDDLIRAYAEEADVSPRRLRLALGLLLGEMQLMGVGLEEARALVMHTRRKLR
ncbi:MAG TPA: helix-turn-helix transcriptional regulator [Polyangiaceae bacterium]